jgi:adenylate cyclase
VKVVESPRRGALARRLLRWVGVTVVFIAGIAVCLAVWLAAALRRVRRLRQALAGTIEDLARLEQAFGRFAGTEVVERLADANGIVPEKRVVTVMFSDLVGYTRLSERVPPAVMVPILNDYLARMSRAIRAHHGHVASLMGDGIMAIWGGLTANPWQSGDAVSAALAMRDELAGLNRELAARGLPELAFGVGVHRGEALAGLMGSPEKMDFTVTGDTVNTAARIESLTRQHGADILVTEAVRDGLDDRFELRDMPPAALKGKSAPMRTAAVIGLRRAA